MITSQIVLHTYVHNVLAVAMVGYEAIPFQALSLSYSAGLYFVGLNFCELLLLIISLKTFREYTLQKQAMMRSVKIFIEIFSRMALNSRKS